MRVRIKVCGMTRQEDASAAARLGVDAIGLVFHAASPRHVTPDEAGRLVAGLPAFVTVTALFLDPSRDEVQNLLGKLRIDLLQFHGTEPSEFCRSFGRPYIKAVPMGSRVDLADFAERYADAAGLLLDSHAAGLRGGTGLSFDWASVPEIHGPPLIIAGGLKPENVGVMIRKLRPYGVDVASGVESAPGVKDLEKLTAFVREVNNVASA